MASPHYWEDVSYHGSPIYQCMACGCNEWDKNKPQFCPEGEEYAKRKRLELELKEKSEYRRLLEQKQRFEYLDAKYGGR